MSLKDKMAAKREKKRLAKLSARQPKWAEDRVYKSAAVLEALREAGDDETAVRSIEHYAIFKSEAAAQVFAKALGVVGGYDSIVVNPVEDGTDFGVNFHESSTTQTRKVFDKTVIAEGRVREAGGAYDGWVTAVVAG